jgi:thiol-disulfide isomerase/thioredoxin
MMITLRHLILFSCLLLLNLSFGQIKEGDSKAAQIRYNKSFPEDYKLPAKKAILLDFWATWCSPCIEGIKESNEWIHEYYSQIEFVCITNHSSKKVDQFIKSGNFKHVFLIDSSNQTFDEYRVETLPTAFIIDTNGLVIWKGSRITKSILDEFLRIGKVQIENTELEVSMNIALVNNFKKTDEDQLKGPSFSMMGAKGDSIKYLIKNTALHKIIEILYNKPKQVIFKRNAYNTHYDLQVSRTNVDLSSINLDILDEISKIIPFSYRIEFIDTSIFELVVKNKDLLYSNRTPSDSILEDTNDNYIDYEYTKENDQVLTAQNVSINELCLSLSKFYDKPVLTNSTLSDKFNLQQVPISDYDQFCEILEKKYGLVLKKTHSKIPFLLIE